MQTATRTSSSGLSQQSRRIALFAVLLFALSGLISGFAVGAFVKPKIAGLTPNSGVRTTPVVQSTKTPVATTVKALNLGYPSIDDFTSSEIANGTTSYSFSSSVPVTDVHTKKPIQVSDVICKLVLTKDANDLNEKLSANNYAIPKAIDTINQPFPGEIANKLTFNASSPQVQYCVPNGKTTWNYTLSSSLDPGKYYFLVMADWHGKTYYWTWQEIRVKSGD